MPKINIRATIKSRDNALVTETKGTLTNKVLKYVDQDKTNMTFNYKNNKLIRDTKDALMTFDFNKEKLTIEDKELNMHMDFKIELIMLTKENNNVEIKYIVDNTHEKETLTYRIEELK